MGGITPEIAIRAVLGQNLSDERVMEIYAHLHAQGILHPMPSQIEAANAEIPVIGPYGDVGAAAK